MVEFEAVWHSVQDPQIRSCFSIGLAQFLGWYTHCIKNILVALTGVLVCFLFLKAIFQLSYNSHAIEFTFLKCTVWYFQYIYKALQPFSLSVTPKTSSPQNPYLLLATPVSPAPRLWKPLIYFLFPLIICLLGTFHENGIMQYLVFYFWFLFFFY